MSTAAKMRTWLGAMALPALFALSAAAQSLPLDDKARYEKALETKVEEVLLKLLGPNQAKVVVQATMDFTRIEKVDVTKGAQEKAPDGSFKWQSPTTEGQPFNEYLLPGFPSMNSENDNQSYQKQILFPTSFVRKLIVTVVVNKEMSEADAQNVRSVVSEVLGLDPGRGDDIAVIRTTFAPLWRTIWYNPESVAMIFKYGLLTLMGIISMMVVAIGFLKLAGAMNTMAKAQQSHQITMDLGKNAGGGAGGAAGGGGGGGGGVAVGGMSGGKLELDITERRERGGGSADIDPEKIFDVKVEQVDFLVNLMGGEDPANIALVAGHLPEAVKSEFLKMLPPETSSEVVANLAKVRFVDPEVVTSIREELEKRLAGAFGGLNMVIDSLDKVNLKAKREMIAQLESRHPDIAAKVRRRILLPEDMLKLSDKELGMLATTVKIEDWAMALWDFDAGFKEKLKGQLTDKTWMMLEQTMKYGAPSPAKTDKAVEAVVNTAIRLINDGRIANPLKAESDQEATQPAEIASAAPGTAPAAPAKPAAPPPPPAPGGKV